MTGNQGSNLNPQISIYPHFDIVDTLTIHQSTDIDTGVQASDLIGAFLNYFTIHCRSCVNVHIVQHQSSETEICL